MKFIKWLIIEVLGFLFCTNKKFIFKLLSRPRSVYLVFTVIYKINIIKRKKRKRYLYANYKYPSTTNKLPSPNKDNVEIVHLVLKMCQSLHFLTWNKIPSSHNNISYLIKIVHFLLKNIDINRWKKCTFYWKYTLHISIVLNCAL